jgi:hypothetical protein
MQKEFKHPQIFADLLVFCQLYYPLHNNLPKPFRFAVGERILDETAQCLRTIVLANALDKHEAAACREGAALLREVRASLEVLRGFLLLAWKLRYVSHGAMGELSTRLEAISRQAARWQQWFEARSAAHGPGGAAPADAAPP